MTGTDVARLTRNRNTPKRATLLELLFDLVYVAAFALLALRLAGSVTWHGVGGTVVLLMAVWWTWSITARVTDFYDPQKRPIEVVIATTMLGTALMTIAIPSAFTQHAAVFAGAYVGIHVVRGGVMVSTLHHARRRVARFQFWFGMSGILWIVGIFVGSPARAVLWTSALAVDFLSAAIRYPTPGLGRVPTEQYGRTSEHLAERYQQVVILALGDLTLIAALTFSRLGFDLARVVALVASFAMMLLLWQLYAYAGGVVSVLVSRRNPSTGPRLAPYTHFLMVAGVVAVAAGSRLVITRPTGHTPVGWVCVLFGGPALFLIGRTIFEYAFAGRLSRARVGWLIVLIVAAPSTTFLPPVFVTVLASVGMAGVAATDHLSTLGKLPRWLDPPASQQ
ncbi:low temperature requirement protein A [Rugosimonospora acidiphila]|uniref:Low temperature requirement protein A n=1 Tax=Rugosimonospora acidiphila TaxID=556531 RepID=A0ABP9RTF3_9ACTN